MSRFRVSAHTLTRARAAIRLMRLDRPSDLLFLLFASLLANWMAAAGRPPLDELLVFLIGALGARCAAWVFLDLATARSLPDAPESHVAQGRIAPEAALRLFGLSGLIGFVSAVYLHRYAVIAAPFVMLLTMLFPWARMRSFVGSLLLPAAIATLAPMAWLAQGNLPDKSAGLLFIAVLLWAVAFIYMDESRRRRELARNRVRSLALLGADIMPLVTGLLMAGALLAAVLAGRQAGLGPLYELGWLGAAAVVVYQVAVLLRGSAGAMKRAYDANVWFGFALWIGAVAHYVCMLTSKNGTV